MAENSLRLGILAIDGCMMSSIASVTDAMYAAQLVAEIRNPMGAPRLETIVFSVRGNAQIQTSTGLTLAGLAPAPEHLDMVLVPGLMHREPRALHERMASLQPEIELLRKLHLHGVRLAACCSGTFLLAATGLLDGRRATTSWWLAGAFRQYFPNVRLEADAMYVEDRELATSGASTAIMGLVMRLIAKAGGEELAQQTSRLLLIDAERQSQAPYVSQALLEQPRTSLAEKAEDFLQRELHSDIGVARLAEHCGTSERSLLRHFHLHYGMGPSAHIQRLRVERAKALLEVTQLTFDEVVERCGYSDVSSFRKLFKRSTTLTPADYRERFRLRAR